jgi:hypothetical protein
MQTFFSFYFWSLPADFVGIFKPIREYDVALPNLLKINFISQIVASKKSIGTKIYST